MERQTQVHFPAFSTFFSSVFFLSTFWIMQLPFFTCNLLPFIAFKIIIHFYKWVALQLSIFSSRKIHDVAYSPLHFCRGAIFQPHNFVKTKREQRDERNAKNTILGSRRNEVRSIRGKQHVIWRICNEIFLC